MHIGLIQSRSLRTLIRRTCVFVLILATPAAFSADSGLTLTEQRKSFVEANQLLDRGKINKWLKIRPNLKSYPLFPYLRLKEVRATQSQFSNHEISQVVTELEIPVPPSFGNWWLKRLLHRGDWELIVKHYSDSTQTTTQCRVAYAKIKLERPELAVPAVRKLWLASRSQPDECDTVFEYGFKNGIIDDRLIFERMLLTKARNDSHMTNYLARLLDSKDFRYWAKQLNAVHRKPKSHIAKNLSKWSQTSQGHGVIQHGIIRMARRDISDTAKFWLKLRDADSAAINRMPHIEKILATRLAWAQHQDAFDWLRGLPDDLHDNNTRPLMARSALALEDWNGVLYAIGLMPVEEANRSEWRFWRARALYESGDEALADHIWSNMASEHHYYGFLAADRLNTPYPIHKPIPPIDLNQSAVRTMSEPAIPRIREWLAMNKPYYSRRELKRLKSTRDNDADFWRHAAIQFNLWGWHDGAIQASYRTDRSSLQLDVTHPSPYVRLVRRESLRYGVPAHWIFSIMRQESHFVHDIRSGRGATGLMQLMHSTAHITANRNGLKKPTVRDLQRADLNIRLGVAYFKQLLNQMNNNPVHALAGYNAGPIRSKKWQESFRASDPAIWVETIVFNETRNYVKNILVNFVIYEQIHSSQSSRIRDYLKLMDIQHAKTSE